MSLAFRGLSQTDEVVKAATARRSFKYRSIHLKIIYIHNSSMLQCSAQQSQTEIASMSIWMQLNLPHKYKS